ncbi:hypothetical protein QUB36_19970, partial [Microcoleus sp. AT8-B1]|uniref:hypothetical protein n=1 Tax=unclassified Microcoleus TaxID=2642155 RepID=UPI002FD00881
ACVKQTASVHPEPGSNSPCWIVFFGLGQVLSTQHKGWLFSLDFFLVVCDIEYQRCLYSQS